MPIFTRLPEFYHVGFGLRKLCFIFLKLLADWLPWWKWRICSGFVSTPEFIVSVYNCSILEVEVWIFSRRIWCLVRCANIWAATKIFIFTTEILRRNLSPVYAERLETVPDQLYWLCGYKMYTRGLLTEQLEIETMMEFSEVNSPIQFAQALFFFFLMICRLWRWNVCGGKVASVILAAAWCLRSQGSLICLMIFHFLKCWKSAFLLSIHYLCPDIWVMSLSSQRKGHYQFYHNQAREPRAPPHRRYLN